MKLIPKAVNFHLNSIAITGINLKSLEKRLFRIAMKKQRLNLILNSREFKNPMAKWIEF